MRAMFFGAHPDDIEPQAGGTIAKFTKAGHEVMMVLAVNTGAEIAHIRKIESVKAAHILGAQIRHLGFEQMDFIFERKVVQAVDAVINEFKPDQIFTCWDKDSHQDHQVISKSVMAACRKNNINLFYYEPVIPGGITPHGFESNYFIDISDTIEEKIKSLRAHESQLAKYGKDWIEAACGRSKFWGFQINTAYAEAFKAVKLIHSIVERSLRSDS